MDGKIVKILNVSGEAKRTIEKIDSIKLLNLDNKNCSRMELFLFALALGVESGIETELTKTDTLVRAEYLNTKNEAYLYSVFISELSDSGDLDKINDVGKVYGKAQRYANTGFKLLEGMMEKAENVVQLEMLQELDEMYDEYF
ncbi:MAG: hypothetical protein PHD70_10400 [Anaerostipes sp.]|nr:hypothetical protein [Anaerostipes sp.]MDD3746868.1 hypothetical protein [Anaerostipes sp.]